MNNSVKSLCSRLPFRRFALGLALGLGVGVATKNIGVGIGVGVAFSIAFGAFGRPSSNNKNSTDDRHTP